MPPLTREHKRVVCAALGTASRLFDEMIAQVSAKLSSHGISLSELKNPLPLAKVGELSGLGRTAAKKWWKSDLEADFESKNKENSGRPPSLDANDVKFIKKLGEKVILELVCVFSSFSSYFLVAQPERSIFRKLDQSKRCNVSCRNLLLSFSSFVTMFVTVLHFFPPLFRSFHYFPLS